MGTITRRTRSDKTAAFTAQIRIKRQGSKTYTEAKTFDREAAARQWLRKREGELAAPGALDGAGDVPLKDIIKRYIEETNRAYGKTKAQVLRSISDSWLGDINATQLKSSEFVKFGKYLEKNGASPSTVSNYMSHLGAVISVAKPAWSYPVEATELKSASVVLKQLGVTGKSKKRERIPAVDELSRLMEFFEKSYLSDKRTIPMHWAVAFLLFSTRRLNECCNLVWEDLNIKNSEQIVRNMKNPGSKNGNDVRVAVTAPALRVLMAWHKKCGAPKKGKIFGWNSDSVSARFTRACKILEIEDLHLHDLRHAGITRLFEIGLSIPKVATVTGHRSWQSLQRYTHIRQSGDVWASWEWLDRLCQVHELVPPLDAALPQS
jgi:integrase